MTTWHVWTDGSCVPENGGGVSGPLGYGGWCAIVEHGSDGHTIRGRRADTTNVRMELTAAVEGLRAVPDGAPVVLHVDCTVVVSVNHRRVGAEIPPRRGARLRIDHDLWVALALELDRLDVRVHLLGKGGRDPIHRRAHAIAGAEARGALAGLPPHAAPLEDGHHRIRKGMRRAQARTAAPRQRLVHAPGCVVGRCVASCPFQQRDGAWPGRPA